jgi:hypothetical protein
MSKNTYLSEVDKALLSLAKKKHVEKNPNKLKFSEDLVEKGHFKKYAFDVYKVDNDPYESLWMLQDFDDGQHLVRASDPTYAREDKGDWTAVSDYGRENVTLVYKNVPIARFSSKEYGFEPTDTMTFKSALLERVETDTAFIKSVLSSEPSGKREALTATFPEFKKFI